MPNLTNSQEPEPAFFGPLESEPFEKKYQEPEPLGKKKPGAGAAKIFAGSPALKITVFKTI